MLAILAPEGPLLGVSKRFNHKIELWNLSVCKVLEGALPEFHPYYVDVSDVIL